MAALVTTDSSARVLLDATSIGFALSEVGIRLRSAAHRSGSNADHGSIVAVAASLAIGVGVAVWAASRLTAATIPGGWAPVVVGLAMMWVGIALREWAVWTLGRYFTVVVRVVDEQSVVDRGPYRWVRHPSYTGLLLTLVGLGVTLANWLSVLALAIIPSIGLVIRIRVEEHALVAAVGEPYREYAARRKRLVPGIW